MEKPNRSGPEDTKNIQLAKLTYDSVKENDLKVIFEILMVSPQNRTISDLDTLIKILIHIEPVKKFNNLSAIHATCKKMCLSKFKTKDIIAANKEESQALYIVLNGKVAFYRKANEYYQSDEIIFLNSGSCFGQMYNWNINFITLAMEETLMAVLNKKEVEKIPLQLSFERYHMLEEIKRSRIFLNTCSDEKLNEASVYFMWSRVPLGTFLMRDGQTPKAIFYIFQGTVRKVFNIKTKEIHVKKYSQGDFCPKSLKQSLNYDLIAECTSEVIIIPRRALNIIGLQHLPITKEINELSMIRGYLNDKDQWTKYKDKLMGRIKSEQKIRKEKKKIR